MKLKQEQSEFRPITITLETAEEADAMWAMAECASSKAVSVVTRELARTISNAFCEGKVAVQEVRGTEYKLGA